MYKDSFKKVFGGKKKVLVVMAHPDDAELYAGGTIARLVGSGIRVRVVKMTLGDMGNRQERTTSKELGGLRQKEDEAAMKVLGILPEDNVYLGLGDGEVEDDLPTIGKLALQIRLFQPDLVITHNPENVIVKFDNKNSWINHRDHRKIGLAVIDGTYPYARDTLFFPEHFKNPLAKSHTVTEYLLVDYYDHPDQVAIEMTDFVGIRVKAHACHSSQYSQEAAQASADFFTLQRDGKRFERFRYVVVD
ncbi:MAG: GlcNAc-PI de-N-acetylase family [Candidatus Amesbacteria bacterium GW2011_GWA1_47_20]|uniref:GlcNAc-PI de-N-acetylase family n=3 Tax=Candidatus Amesiibacteriota TaxID=1752730 RepID=A0A0G1SK28_9BACT|nr:MAG: GlcNAc-PI de-N-acetylase family [Microgenomates group bacterium GW2011_GWC1_46_20]KKU69771.1 MAG: GlcNAc-PI de-N-acetylase family [Candidatus Amesbacteria bacterium GW2011_GWA1_47_20]